MIRFVADCFTAAGAYLNILADLRDQAPFAGEYTGTKGKTA